MNKIYKVVWSKVKNCYVVVSELAKNIITGGVKSAKVGATPMAKGLALGAAMAFVITGNVWAANTVIDAGTMQDNTIKYTISPSIGDNISVVGETIKINKGVELWGPYYPTTSSTTVLLGDSNTDNINISSPDRYGIFAYGDGCEVTVNADTLTIQDSYAGIWGANRSDSTGDNFEWNEDKTALITDDNARVVINAGTTTIKDCDAAIVAQSQATVEINGNLYATGTSEVLDVRGESVTNINKANDENVTVQLKGDIVFDPSSKKNQLVDANVNINLANKDSWFEGQIRNDAPVDLPEQKGKVTGMKLGLSNGAEWRVTNDSFVNTLAGNGGKLVNKSSEDKVTVTVLGEGSIPDRYNVYEKVTVDGKDAIAGSAITNKNLNVDGVDLVIDTEKTAIYNQDVTIKSNADVTIKSQEKGVSAYGEVGIEAENVTISTKDDGIFSAGDANPNDVGNVNIKANGNVNITSAEGYAVNNASINNGKVNVSGEFVTLVSNDRTAVKVGHMADDEGYNGVVNIGDENTKAITIAGKAQDPAGDNERKSAVVYAQGDGTVNLNATVGIGIKNTGSDKGAAIGAYNGGAINVDAGNGTVDAYGQVLAWDSMNTGKTAVSIEGNHVNVESVEDALDAMGGTIEVDATNINIKSTAKDGIQSYDANVVLNGENVNVKGKDCGIKNVVETASGVEVNGTNVNIEGAEHAIGVFYGYDPGSADYGKVAVGEVSVSAEKTLNITGEVYGEMYSEISLKGESVNVAGGAKDALESCGGTISVDATNINITSDTNDGIQAEDAIVTLEAKENVIIDAGQWAIKNIEDTNSIVEINATNINITGGKEVQDGGAIWAFQVDDSDGQGKVIVNGSGTTTIDGDIKAEGNSEVSVLLNNEKSSLTGAVTTDGATTALTMNSGANWYVTGESTVSEVTGNKGNIDFTKVDDVKDGYVTIKENKNENLTVTQDVKGEKAATKENLENLRDAVKVEKGNAVGTATLTNAAIAGDVTMDAEGNTTTTLYTDLHVTGDVVAGDVSLQETAANLDAEVANRQAEVGRLDNRIDKVDAKIDKVGAMAAAMASLKTMGYDPEAPTEIAVGVGQYRNETGLAIGAFHYPNKNFMLNFSLSTAGDEVMGGIGATWKIGRKR